MLYYLCLVWNCLDRTKSNTAKLLLRRFRSQHREWQAAVQQDGLAVCYSISPGPNIDAPCLLHNQCGVVLGTLFPRIRPENEYSEQTMCGKIVLDERRTMAIVATQGRDLIENYWGRYVAFLRDPGTRKSWVIRDPTGSLPCQHTQVDGIDVYFVRLEDYRQLMPLRASINHRYLLGYLMYNNTSVPDTGLNEVSTLLAGECAEHDGDVRTCTFYWNPVKIAETDVIEDFTDAARMTRNAVRASVHAWASLFDGILLRLSGGLDSSIVLSCLATAPTRPHTVCLNDFSLGLDCDERSFARCAARQAGCELIEEQEAPSYDLSSLRQVPLALSPFPCVGDSEAAHEETRWMRERGLSALFTGHGGDEVFYRVSTLPTAVDYAWLHGLSSRLLSIALDDAISHRISLWRVLSLVKRYGLLKRSWSICDLVGKEHRSLLLKERMQEARREKRLWHPLYRETASLPPNKLGHAYTITAAGTRGHIPGLPGGGPVYLSPLVSQPLLEVSLRIPVYLLKLNGRDRAVARCAFTPEVPEQIILRKSKGFGNAVMEAVILRNIRLARELLLDGFLVQNRFLDRARLEEVLCGDGTSIKSHTVEILICLSVEGWARSWCDDRRQVAA